MRARTEADTTLFGRVFEGVRNQIAEGLIEELRVAPYPTREFLDAHLQPSTNSDFVVVASKAFEHLLEIEWTHSRPQIATHELDRVHQTRDKARHPEHARANFLGAAGNLSGFRPFLCGDQTLGVTVNRHQWSAEFVRDGADKIPLLRRERALLGQGAREDLRLAREALARVKELDGVAAK